MRKGWRVLEITYFDVSRYELNYNNCVGEYVVFIHVGRILARLAYIFCYPLPGLHLRSEEETDQGSWYE